MLALSVEQARRVRRGTSGGLMQTGGDSLEQAGAQNFSRESD